MNLPKNLILKAEEITELKRYNQLIIEQNQLLAGRNQNLLNQNKLLAKQIDEKWGQIEIKLLDMRIMIQSLNLAKLFVLHLLWTLQSSLLKQKYLTEKFLNLDIEGNLLGQKKTLEIIQDLKNQRVKY